MKKIAIIAVTILLLLAGIASCDLETDPAPTNNQPTINITDETDANATAPTTEPPHTHSFSAATCTTPKTCSCGETEGSPLGHEWKSATCTEAKECSNCGLKDGKSLGHNYSGGKCTRCGTKDPNASSNTNSNTSTNSTKVWVTEKGKKYHCDKNCSNMKNPYQITKEEAINSGRSACSKCY